MDLPEPKTLLHVGTRYEHLRDLSSAWQDGIDAIESRSYLNKEDKQKILDLKVGVVLIDYVLASMSRYNDQLYRLGSLIDAISAHEPFNAVKPQPVV